MRTERALLLGLVAVCATLPTRRNALDSGSTDCNDEYENEFVYVDGAYVPEKLRCHLILVQNRQKSLASVPTCEAPADVEGSAWPGGPKVCGVR